MTSKTLLIAAAEAREAATWGEWLSAGLVTLGIVVALMI